MGHVVREVGQDLARRPQTLQVIRATFPNQILHAVNDSFATRFHHVVGVPAVGCFSGRVLGGGWGGVGAEGGGGRGGEYIGIESNERGLEVEYWVMREQIGLEVMEFGVGGVRGLMRIELGIDII